jgi:glutathione S-transferase
MKLYYFDVYGRAEPIRVLLWHAKQEFEDVRMTQEQFATLCTENKVQLEFGQVPVLELDGKFYCQSHAILRMLGMKFGYYPADAEAAWKVDSTLDAISDVVTAMFKVTFGPADQKDAAAKTFLTEYLPVWLAAIEARLKKNSDPHYFSGDKYTIADFAFNGLLSSTFFNEGCEFQKGLHEVIEKYETILAYGVHHKAVFQAYLDARPTPRPF